MSSLLTINNVHAYFSSFHATISGSFGKIPIRRECSDYFTACIVYNDYPSTNIECILQNRDYQFHVTVFLIKV